MWFLHRKSRALEEADKALEQAHEAKDAIEARGPEVTNISNALREMRERNHFIERMQGIIDRRGPVNDA